MIKKIISFKTWIGQSLPLDFYFWALSENFKHHRKYRYLSNSGTSVVPIRSSLHWDPCRWHLWLQRAKVKSVSFLKNRHLYIQPPMQDPGNNCKHLQHLKEKHKFCMCRIEHIISSREAIIIVKWSKKKYEPQFWILFSQEINMYLLLLTAIITNRYVNDQFL